MQQAGNDTGADFIAKPLFLAGLVAFTPAEMARFYLNAWRVGRSQVARSSMREITQPFDGTKIAQPMDGSQIQSIDALEITAADRRLRTIRPMGASQTAQPIDGSQIAPPIERLAALDACAMILITALPYTG